MPEDMPCGEAGCFCRCTGPVGHACACDCPHDDDCDCDFCTADEY